MIQLRLGTAWPCASCNADHAVVVCGKLQFVFHARGHAQLVGREPSPYAGRSGR